MSTAVDCYICAGLEIILSIYSAKKIVLCSKRSSV